MRHLLSAALTLTAALLPISAFAQTDRASEILEAAESSYPESKAPALYGPGSASAPYAAELADEIWAPDMEVRILAQVEQERDEGLIYRRADVECRTSTCAVLLIHAADQDEGSVGDLVATLRGMRRFGSISTSATEIPMPETTEDGLIRTWFMSAYVEILLTGALRSPAAGR